MNLSGIFTTIQNILNLAIPVLLSLGVVYFVWGVVQYVIAGGDEAKKTGKDRIIYGIIGLAVIVSIWGLVNIVASTFNLGNASAPVLTSTEGGSCNTTGGLWAKGKDFQDIAGFITCTIKNSIIPFIFALALATFVFGVVNFFFIGSGEEKKRTQGKQFMIWGLVALTVMLSIWGLVAILTRTFGINTKVGIPEAQTK